MPAPVPALPQNSIFICYRRSDSEEMVDRIYETLSTEFGPESIFRDIDNIPAGVDFPSYIEDSLRGCPVVLVFIGREWTSCVDERGTTRLQDPEDHVRIEVETALALRDTRVIPVLVRRASIPAEKELPETLRVLRRRNGVTVRGSGPDYRQDVTHLAATLRRAVNEVLEKRRRALGEGNHSVAMISPTSEITRQTAARSWWEPWLGRIKKGTSRARAYARVYPQRAAGVGVGALVFAWLVWKVAHPTPAPIAKPDPRPPETPAPIAEYVAPSKEPSIVTPTPQPNSEPPVAWWKYLPPNLIPGRIPSDLPPDSPPAVTLDPKLVGTWSTKVTTPNGYMTFRWEQSADGNYRVTGTWSDAGTVDTQDGMMRRTSSVTHLTGEFPYEFKGNNELITKDPSDPFGAQSWKRVSSPTPKASTKEKSSTTRSKSSDNYSAPRSNPPPDFRRFVPRGFPHF